MANGKRAPRGARFMTADEIITAEVTSWEGVTAGDGERGEYGFRLGAASARPPARRPRPAHRLPQGRRQELYDAGRIDYHPVFPTKKGWASRAILTPEDVEDVIALLRLNYDRAVATHGVPV